MNNKVLILFVTLFVFAMSPFAHGKRNIKKPNVSGKFYTANAKELSAQVARMIEEANIKPYDAPVEVIIAPHAGYYYSGAVAGYSFKAVSKQTYSTVIILAPSHFYGFDGISVWDHGGFETPLGVVDVDEEFAQKLTAAHEKILYDPKAFEQEHSLEVEIPFVQKTFKDAKIVPVVMGQPRPEILLKFAKYLHESIADREDVLVVVSTDLSHYHNDAVARKMDQRAIEAIKRMDVEKIYEGCQRQTIEMCGCIPVVSGILLAKLRGLNQVEVLKYANSGDVSGEKDRVVGYSSIVFYKKDSNPEKQAVNSLSIEQKRKLLQIARQSISAYVQSGKKIEVNEKDQRLLQEEGAFVSIYKKGRLRGCIGNIIGSGPLCMTVRNMAISSATRDHRFQPLKKEELEEIDLEVSVLSKPRRIFDLDEIVLGTHGVIISRGGKSGVFLPQVADSTGWTKEQFLSELCSQKAGLPSDCWKDPKKTTIEIYTAEVFSDKELQNN